MIKRPTRPWQSQAPGAPTERETAPIDLIDEYYIFRNPVAIGNGLTIFKDQKVLQLESSTLYKNGKLLEKYLPA